MKYFISLSVGYGEEELLFFKSPDVKSKLAKEAIVFLDTSRHSIDTVIEISKDVIDKNKIECEKIIDLRKVVVNELIEMGVVKDTHQKDRKKYNILKEYYENTSSK